MIDPGKRKYSSNHLTQVIYQIVFDKTDAIDDNSMKLFKGLLGDEYTVLATVKEQGFILQNDGSDIKAEKDDRFIWQIDSEDKTHFLRMTKDSFSITFTQYKNFKEYSIVVENAHKAFRQIFTDIQELKRLGLRYVNQIKPLEKKVKWNDYINPKLVDSLGFADQSIIRRSMHSMVLAHDKETLVTINYGIYNQYFPSPVVDNEFIIDIDAYTPFAVVVADCESIITGFNKTIATYFEMSIGKKLRDEMGIIDEEQ